MAIKKISIITVCYNDCNNLLKTVSSLKGQSYRDYVEHIIIDGGSTDGTAAVIEQFGSDINRWISERDGGLYDAMNKGIGLAQGSYLWFMNAGDVFAESRTIEYVLKAMNDEDIIYGAANFVDADDNLVGAYHKKLPKHLDWKSFINGMVVCHQALIIKRDIVQNYDLKYKIAADIDWAIRTVRKAKDIKNIDLILCNFQTGGLSQKRKKLALSERFLILRKHYGLTATVVSHIKIVIKSLMGIK